MSSTNDFIVKGGVLNMYLGAGGDVVIPNGVTSIGEQVFEDCSSLTSVTIPEGVTSIGNWAFDSCPRLTIHVPAGSYAEKYARENRITFVWRS